jgi:hypothetical protein
MIRLFILLLFCTYAVCRADAPSLSDMTSPSIDDPSKEWCFLARSTTVIGVPFQPDVTQVTYDGALFTGEAELSFYYGTEMKPMMARQKTFFEGWMPLVEYAWREGAIRYEFEAFAQALPGEDAKNTVNFVRLTMSNTGTEPATGFIWSGFRHKLDDSRFGGSPFQAGASYTTSSTGAFRNGSLIYSFPESGRALGATKQRERIGAAEVSEQTLLGIAGYSRTLNPGQSAAFDFKMPRVPVSLQKTEFLTKLSHSNYSAMRKQTIAFWKKAILGKTEFRIPEPRVQNSQRASLVHMMLATRERDHKRFQTDGLPYPDLFLTSNVQAEMAYDFLGRENDYAASLDEVLSRQSPLGIFMDTSLPQNAEPLIVAQGQTLHALSYHAVITHDLAFAKRVFPAVSRGVAWVKAAQRKDAYGLMPPSWPYDNEMILGRYTSHNLWCLLGVRSAIRLARLLGETRIADDWVSFEAEYRKAIVKALHASALPDGSVPPGLYEVKTGNDARAGFRQYQTNQDWENMLLATPTEVLPPDDPLLTATLKRLHREKFREGVMTYRNGQHLHQYITANVMEQEMARGEQEQALTDLYHMLLHNGPTHEGFENLVQPWTRQVDPNCPPPHAWAAMKTALVIRNMLLVERGGNVGLQEDRRDLHLFSLLSPAWVQPGAEVGFRNAPCEMGSISASLKFRSGGADLVLDPNWRTPPRSVVVHIPWFEELTAVNANGSFELRNGALILDPHVSRAHLHWHARKGVFSRTLQNILLAYRREPDFKMVGGEGVATPGREGGLSPSEEALPPTPLSFNAVLNAYQIEYFRRFRDYESAKTESR